MPIKFTEATPRSSAVELSDPAAALNHALEGLGVDYLFSMESPAALHASLREGGITAVTVHDERSAAFMADGYARVSGKPGVCAVAAVGATNTVQGVVEAHLGSTPVVILAEAGSAAARDRNDFQDVNPIPILTPVTKWAGEVGGAERVAEVTALAFRVATSGRPGPVLITYPYDIVSCDPHPVPGLALEPATFPSHRVGPDPVALAPAVEILRSAERPVIVAGGGVLISRAEDVLAALAQVLGAPVASTSAAKGVFAETDPLSAGVIGALGGAPGSRGRVATDVVLAADVVLLIGSKTGSWCTDNWTVPGQDQTIVHVDIDPAETGRNYPGSVPLIGDARLVIEALLAALDGSPRGERAGRPRGWPKICGRRRRRQPSRAVCGPSTSSTSCRRGSTAKTH